jgi:hypothetical protein
VSSTVSRRSWRFDFDLRDQLFFARAAAFYSGQGGVLKGDSVVTVSLRRESRFESRLGDICSPSADPVLADSKERVTALFLEARRLNPAIEASSAKAVG